VLAAVNAGNPPDVALAPQPGLVRELAERNALRPLTSDTVESLARDYDSHWSTFTSVGGLPRGVFVDVAAKSLVWYRPDVFAEAGYEVPATWEELLLLTAVARNDERTPWCMGMGSLAATGWPGTDWIEDLLLRRQPPGLYDSWVAGTVPFTDPRIAQTFEDYGAVALTPGSVNGGSAGALTTRWDEAGLPLLDDPAGCLMFKQASFWADTLPDGTTLGPDGDLAVFAFPPVGTPGPAPMVVSGSMAIPMGARDETDDLMAWLTSVAGSAALLDAGFVSPNESVDAAAAEDPFAAEVADLVRDAPVVRFDGSDQMPPVVGSGTFFDGIIRLLSGDDTADVVDTIQQGWDEVSQSQARREEAERQLSDPSRTASSPRAGTGEAS
jgi:alpha-glucoside transport system substrate-binding protein